MMTSLENQFDCWRGLTGQTPGDVIRLVLADVDGVVTPGEGHVADFAVLARLAEFNRLATIRPDVPAITLCTGRPAPYVEALANVIGSFLPSVFEQGCGLFEPRSFAYLFHPALPPDFPNRLIAFRQAIDADLLRPRRAAIQPGKEASMTLYPVGGTPLATVIESAEVAAARLGGDFTVLANLLGVEIRPVGIDKGVGARWLAELIGLNLATQVAGVGDSEPDLAFLRLVAHPAAPSNAAPIVRANVPHVAAAPFGAGLLKVIDQIVARNAAALR